MVLGDVPQSERCRCHEQPTVRAASKSGAATPAADQSASSRFKAWLRK
jgi:hypothetical protein